MVQIMHPRKKHVDGEEIEIGLLEYHRLSIIYGSPPFTSVESCFARCSRYVCTNYIFKVSVDLIKVSRKESLPTSLSPQQPKEVLYQAGIQFHRLIG